MYDSRMDKIKWIIFTVIVVGVLGGVVWLNKSDDVVFTGDAAKVITEGPIADHVYGSADQKVTLIEYGDFQCPGCGAMFTTVSQLKEAYKDKLTFVFRNLPLTNIHPNALAAATAVEAAGLQGKYWEMHDLLYQSQQAWSSADANSRTTVFEGYASQLGIDMDKFKQDLSSKDIAAKISRDRTTSKTFAADSTPTFIIDGKKFDSTKSTDQEALIAAVEDALRAAYPDFQPILSAQQATQ